MKRTWTIVGVAEGAVSKNPVVRALTAALGPSVAKTLEREEFTGKKDQLVDFPSFGKLKKSYITVFRFDSAT